jgi:hypothetical protein
MFDRSTLIRLRIAVTSFAEVPNQIGHVDLIINSDTVGCPIFVRRRRRVRTCLARTASMQLI